MLTDFWKLFFRTVGFESFNISMKPVFDTSSACQESFSVVASKY